jgi:hypothetical protein
VSCGIYVIVCLAGWAGDLVYIVGEGLIESQCRKLRVTHTANKIFKLQSTQKQGLELK